MRSTIRSLKAGIAAVVAIAALFTQCIPSPSTIQPMSPATRKVVGSQPATFRVAAIQFISEFGDPRGNFERLIPLIRQAAEHGAKVVVLPETAITGYSSSDLNTVWQVEGRKVARGKKGVSPVGVAETPNGPSVKALAELAGQLDIYLTIPFVEVDAKSERYFNTVILAGPDGRLLLQYRKLNPWPTGEAGWATKGDNGQEYIDTPYGRLGVLICYDILFEMPAMEAANVDTVLYSTAWWNTRLNRWFEKGLPEVTRRHGINIVAANRTVPVKPDWYGYGQSRIIENDGKILARAKNDLADEIIYADLPVGE